MNRPVLPKALNTRANEDWDCLFRSVLTRLRLARGSTQEIHDTVMECVDALEKLNAMLVHARRQDMAARMQAIVVARFTQPSKQLRECDSSLRDTAARPEHTTAAP